MAANFQSFEGQSAGSRVYHCGDGFYYHFNNQYLYGHNEGAGEVYLRCRHYGSARARRGAATVTVSEDNTKVWTNTHQHTCAPDLLLWEVRALKRRIIQEAIGAARYESPSELVQRIREEFRPEVAARVTVAGMRCAIQEARSGPYPPVPVSLEGLGLQLQLHPNLTSTSDNQDNFFGGVVHGPNGTTSVVFVSRRIRRYMRRARIVFADGTFSSRPNAPGCAQVLQILTVIRNAAVPLVQVLLEGKTEEEYTAVLQYLHNLVPRFRPRLVMTDFEIALQNAWRTVFPMARVSGCYWHYCRAILKKAKELGLTAFVNQNRRHRSLLRAFCGIPLLPQHLIVRGVASLAREKNRLGVVAQMQEFYDYFVDTWISHPFYGSLSVSRLQHRTNNVAESCNKLLRSKTGVHKPGLWHFLSALKKYEYYSFMTTRTADLGLPLNRARKVSAVNNDARIKNYTTDVLNGNISVNTFLHRASTRVLNVYDRFIV